MKLETVLIGSRRKEDILRLGLVLYGGHSRRLQNACETLENCVRKLKIGATWWNWTNI